MATIARKRFRIEMLGEAAGTGAPSADGAAAAARHHAVMAALAEIRALLADEPAAALAPAPAEPPGREGIDEVLAFRSELGAIHGAILRTKQEIASLHHSGFQGMEMSSVRDELDAIVAGTEQATEAILAAAEAVDERAGDLSAKLKGDEQGMASDIQDQTVRIFEACNFQDLTGQRITKIVATLRFIETRVERMIEIWGGLECFAGVEHDTPTKPGGDRALLNGPALEGEPDRASQDEIDALFA